MTGRTAFIRLLLAAVVLVAAAPPASAKGGPLGLWPQRPEASMDEALETPYARALLKQFAANVRKDGDAACLQEKGLDEAALIKRGRALVHTYGVQTIKLMEENFDDAAAQAAFAESAGPKAREEYQRLLRHPDVARFESINRPILLAVATDMVFEQFDRYLLIARIKLDPASPDARGESDNEVTRADPVPKAKAAGMRFIETKASPAAMDKYFDLTQQYLAANRRGIRKEGLGKLTPMNFFAGADKDLAELCVGKR